MTEGPLHLKLDPQRFTNMSLPMAAILGFVLERQFTTPAIPRNGHPATTDPLAIAARVWGSGVPSVAH
jgi:hypothetical protein